MSMPGFGAEMSLNRGRESYRSRSISGDNNLSSTHNVVVLARLGPVSDCACCIFLDKYNCCRDCVEAILA